jgi:hypothetical protein
MNSEDDAFFGMDRVVVEKQRVTGLYLFDQRW